MRTSTVQPPLGTPVNHSHPLSYGLVGAWIFNESGGQKAFDSSGYSPISGALTNGAVFQQSAKGNCVFFDGTNDYIAAAAGDLSGVGLTRTGTIISWINLASSPNAFGGIIYKRLTGSAVGYDYGIDMAASGNQIRGLISNGTSNGIITGGTSLSSNVWYQICFSWDSANLNAYLNGVVDATPVAQTFNAQNVTTHPLEIGRGNDPSPVYFKGLIGSTFIWNRALSQGDIRQLYVNPYAMFQGYYQNGWVDNLIKYKFNNSGIRPRPFAPGIAR